MRKTTLLVLQRFITVTKALLGYIRNNLLSYRRRPERQKNTPLKRNTQTIGFVNVAAVREACKRLRNQTAPLASRLRLGNPLLRNI